MADEPLHSGAIDRLIKICFFVPDQAVLRGGNCDLTPNPCNSAIRVVPPWWPN